jgi:hypothetical protein
MPRKAAIYLFVLALSACQTRSELEARGSLVNGATVPSGCDVGSASDAFSVRCQTTTTASAPSASTSFSWAAAYPAGITGPFTFDGGAEGFCGAEIVCADGNILFCVAPTQEICSASKLTSDAQVTCGQNRATCAPPATSGASIPESAGWPLTFDDEFDAPHIDNRKWTSNYNGFNANSILLRDGTAVLHIDASGDSSPPWEPNGHVVALNTDGIFSQKYGWFEIRAKVASGAGRNGVVSAFWLVPADASYRRSVAQGGTRPLAAPFEIDIFEQYSGEPHGNTSTVHAGNNADFAIPAIGVEGTDRTHRVEATRTQFPFVLADDFHTFALLWTPKTMTWFVDGQEQQRLGPPPTEPFYILLNEYRHADADPALPFPDDFAVDYVRVYALPPNFTE